MSVRKILAGYMKYGTRFSGNIVYANGTEVDIDTLTEAPEILTYIHNENESFTLVNNAVTVYSICCRNHRDHFHGIPMLDIGFVATSENIGYGRDYDRSYIDVYPIVGSHMCETYGKDYPSKIDAIYRIIKMAGPLVASILDKNNLISYIESPIQSNSILKFAKSMDLKKLLSDYSEIYYMNFDKCNIYANDVMVNIDTLTELPEALVFIRHQHESFTLVTTYINNTVVTYGIYCSICINYDMINLVYLTYEDNGYKYSPSAICLHPIIGKYMNNKYGNSYSSDSDVIYRLIRMANYVFGLLFDQDELISRIISSSLVKRASH